MCVLVGEGWGCGWPSSGHVCWVREEGVEVFYERGGGWVIEIIN